MDGTARAGGFCLSIATVFQTAVGIVQETEAVGTERLPRGCIMVLVATIQANHKCYCALLCIYS